MRSEEKVCNKCGECFRGKGLEVKVNWGYDSTGKDGDKDVWDLCDECLKNFRSEARHVCSMCLKTLIEIKIEIMVASKDPRFHNNYEAAAQSKYRTNYDYAVIDKKIVCEICYDKFTNDFKLPIPYYDFLFSAQDTGTPKYHDKNRTKRGMNLG